MKKLLLFAIICLFSTKAFCQAQGVTIVNNTGCDVYVVLYGDVPPNCTHSYRSAGFTVPAGGSYVIYYPTQAPAPSGSSRKNGMTDGSGNWLTSTDVIDDVRIYHGDPGYACMPTGHVDMGSCDALIAPIDIWEHTGGTCLFCSSKTASFSLTTASMETVTIY